MPCNSIITQSVDLDKCGDLAMLGEAVAQVDMKGCYLYGHKIIGDARIVGEVSDAVKRQYSKLSVYKAAKQNGWQVKEISATKLQVIRR